jgi:putative transposase
LKQGRDGVPVADICRKAGISQAIYFNWKKKLWSAAGRDASAQAAGGWKRQAEEVGGRLVAWSRLQDVIRRKLWGLSGSASWSKRFVVSWDLSIRRACRVLEMDTSTYHYKSRRPEQVGLEQRIKEICQTRVRYGYRRIHVHLRREGWPINQKKTRRIYRELGLQFRNKTPKRRVKAKLRDDRRPATRSNEDDVQNLSHN